MKISSVALSQLIIAMVLLTLIIACAPAPTVIPTIVVPTITADANATTFNGTVIYSGAEGLPDGAIVTLQLVDIDPTTSQASTIGTQRIDNPPTLPIPFAIPYNTARIDPTHTYALQAQISVNGDTRWLNKTAYFVLTNGGPSDNVEVLVEPR